MRDEFQAAFRSLRAAKSFSVPAFIVLTLAIGASTALFSIVDAVVLRGLPFDDSDRLVAVGERQREASAATGNPRDPEALAPVAPQNYLDWTAEQKVFEEMAAIASGWLTLHRPAVEPESLVPQYVTPGFFDVLRVRPARGRVFGADGERAGSDRVAVLSDRAWRRHFDADPGVIGRALTLDDVERGQGTYEVVGVMPPGFAYPVGAARPTDIWIPYIVPPDQRIRSAGARVNYLQVIARLRPGVSVSEAQAQMRHVAAALERAHPHWNSDNSIGVRRLVDHVVGSRTRSWMLMLLAAVALVLAIACANVANLFLARAAVRRRELGVRAALGASRWRLVRQLVIESVALSAAATACAVLLAWWAVDVLKAALPGDLPRLTTIAVDFRVLAVAAGLSMGTGLLVGIVPAVQVSKRDVTDALAEGSRTTTGAGGGVRTAFIVAELALAAVLLVGAALFISSFIAVMRVDPGLDPENVLTAQLSPRMDARRPPPDSSPVFAELVERLGRIPGVRHASMIGANVPLFGGSAASPLTIPGRIDPTAGEMIAVSSVTPAYHAALGVPLRRGRPFSATDRKDAPQVAIINEAAGRKYFPGEDPIGRQVGVEGARTIVGVVGDVHQTSLEVDPRPEAYLPMAQARAFGGSLVIRTEGNPYDTLPAVRSAVFGVLPDVPLRNVMTMEELIGTRVAARRLTMLLFGLFGALALVISAVGVYGVIAFAVSQRTREIGVRMALGATPSRVVAAVLLNAAGVVGAGLTVGGAAAWYLSATVEGFLFRIAATDVRAFAVAFLVLAGAGLVAAAIPARRAASVDPLVVLRAE